MVHEKYLSVYSVKTNSWNAASATRPLATKRSRRNPVVSGRTDSDGSDTERQHTSGDRFTGRRR
jgi:hypothetical protein